MTRHTLRARLPSGAGLVGDGGGATWPRDLVNVCLVITVTRARRQQCCGAGGGRGPGRAHGSGCLGRLYGDGDGPGGRRRAVLRRHCARTGLGGWPAPGLPQVLAAATVAAPGLRAWTLLGQWRPALRPVPARLAAARMGGIVAQTPTTLLLTVVARSPSRS